MKSPRANTSILILSALPPTVNAGAEKNVFNLATHLLKYGFQVTFCSFRRGSAQSFQPEIQGLKVKEIRYFNNNFLAKLFSAVLYFIPGYVGQIIAHDLIFITGRHLPGWKIILVVARILGKQTMFRSTMYQYDDAHTLVTQATFPSLVRRILSRLNFYYSLHPGFSEVWRQNISGSTIIFESVQGVDIHKFSPVDDNERLRLRNKMGFGPDEFIILTVGYVVKRKGLPEIFRILSNLRFPFRYIVAGDYDVPEGHYKHYMKDEMQGVYKMGKELLGDKVMFTGARDGVENLYRVSDCFLLNSIQEGLPNVLLEAMSSGIPVCSRAIPGISYIIEHQSNGLIFRDSNEMTLVLNNLHQDQKLRKKLGQQAHVTAINRFSFECVVENLSKTLEI